MGKDMRETPLLEFEKKNTEKSISRKERTARNMVLGKKRKEVPLPAAGVSADEKTSLSWNIEKVLNLANGNRNLLEILGLLKSETGKALEEEEISDLIRHLNILDKHGCVRIHYRVKLGREDIKEGLSKLGIMKGDRIIVHSSLSSLGYVEGGVETVIKALMELVTKKGVLMMPSFNHGIAFKEGYPGYYSPEETPTTNGKVPDTFWRMKEVHRSLDPTHPFAVWGANATTYVKTHHKVLTMGEGSPPHLLEKAGGKVVLIGCPTANSFHHVVEMTNDVPCLGKRTKEHPVKLPGGKIVKCRTWGFRKGPCSVKVVDIYREMKRQGLIGEGEVGNAEVLVFKMKDYRKVAEKFFRGEIRNVPGCKDCTTLPGTNKYSVESDWNDESGEPEPDTTAFIDDIHFGNSQ